MSDALVATLVDIRRKPRARKTGRAASARKRR